MANIYLKLVEDGRQLPAACRALGSPAETFTDSGGKGSVTGWKVCQFLYKMNEDGQEWWSNDFNLIVDESGQFWELVLGEQYDPHDGRTSHVSLGRVDAQKFRSWHMNNWDFQKIRDSIESLI